MVKIGDIDVGVQGFGCMGITAFYGIPMEVCGVPSPSARTAKKIRILSE
jgi:hypothetical protein